MRVVKCATSLFNSLQSKLHVFVARFIVPLASPRASFPSKNRESHRSRGGEPQNTNPSLFPSSKISHFQNEAKRKTFLVKISFMCKRIKPYFRT